MSKRDLENEFEAKYNEYGNMLYKIAFLYLGSATDTEDVLQNVFTKYLCGKYKFKNSEHEKAEYEKSVCSVDGGRSCAHYKKINRLYECGKLPIK